VQGPQRGNLSCADGSRYSLPVTGPVRAARKSPGRGVRDDEYFKLGRLTGRSAADSAAGAERGASMPASEAPHRVMDSTSGMLVAKKVQVRTSRP